VYGPADGLHGLAEVGPCDIFVSFLFFSPFLTFIIGYFYIFLFLHITKASPRLTPYRLKGKKGVCRLESPYRLKNYVCVLPAVGLTNYFRTVSVYACQPITCIAI
jgi:hypothetical protein